VVRLHGCAFGGAQQGLDLSLAGEGDGLCLDLGCGTGLYSEMLASTGMTVLGIDVSADQLRIARHRETVALADATQLPFPETSFQLVTSIWVHSDIDDLAGMLSAPGRRSPSDVVGVVQRDPEQRPGAREGA